MLVDLQGQSAPKTSVLLCPALSVILSGNMFDGQPHEQ
jgi:hypothetical protein